MRLTLEGKLLVTFTFILFVHSYFTINLFTSLMGLGIFTYLLFSKSAFGHATRIDGFDLKRQIDKKTYFANDPVNVSVKYSLDLRDNVFISITDTPPADTFILEGSNRCEEFVSAFGEISYSYNIVKTKRGTAIFEGSEVVMTDKRNIFSFGNYYPKRDEIIYQDSEDRIRQAEKMAASTKKKDIIRDDYTLMPGNDFAGIREYQPGDRISDIDWKASSRLQQLLTKLSESETYGKVYILLDVSRSMRRSYGNVSKFNHSILLSMQLAKIFLEHDNPTGFVAFDEFGTYEYVNPSEERGQYKTILSALQSLPDDFPVSYALAPSYEQRPIDMESKIFLEKIIPYLSRKRKRFTSMFASSGLYAIMNKIIVERKEKALLIVLSDLESNTSSLVSSLKTARLNDNNVILITPYSPWFGTKIDELTIPLAEELYSSYIIKRNNMNVLKNTGVVIIEETPEDSVDIIYPKIARELR